MLSDVLACPLDLALLRRAESGTLVCTSCSRTWAIVDGVVQFLETKDEFYEGAYRNQVNFIPRSERFFHAWPLWLVNSGYPWVVRSQVPAGATVLELGCAGGVRYFGQRYRMLGCDLSHASLRSAVGIYDVLLHANASVRLPIADMSLDAVVSSFFWEHIPATAKVRILAEIYRVLKPGGRLVFLYDVETNNPLIRRLKERDLASYRRLFIEGDGHLGYESRDANIAGFGAAGFAVLLDLGLEATFVQSPSVFAKLVETKVLPRPLSVLGASFGNHPWHRPYTALVRAIDATVGRFARRDWSRLALTACAKPEGPTGLIKRNGLSQPVYGLEERFP